MIVSFAGQKGGVGKTTTAICVATELLGRGCAVLLVDADPQLSARTWTEVASEGGHACPTCVAMGKDMWKPDQLPRLAKDFDHVVIDCPPAHGEIQRAALMCSHVAVFPCGQTTIDAWAMAGAAELVLAAKAANPALQAAVLIAKKSPRTAIGREARSVLAESGLAVMASELTHRVSYQETLAAGMGVGRYAPRDRAAQEIRALVDELLLLGAPATPTRSAKRAQAKAQR